MRSLRRRRRHSAVIVCGATGSGKSTQLPKLCLDAGRGISALIGHTQPRRIAARALDAARNPASASAVTGFNTQLAMLLPPDFIEATPHPWLSHLPRYLKAITRRLGRLPAEARRDEELAARVRPFISALGRLQAQLPDTGARPELQQLRWMLEEFRAAPC